MSTNAELQSRIEELERIVGKLTDRIGFGPNGIVVDQLIVMDSEKRPRVVLEGQEGSVALLDNSQTIRALLLPDAQAYYDGDGRRCIVQAPGEQTPFVVFDENEDPRSGIATDGMFSHRITLRDETNRLRAGMWVEKDEDTGDRVAIIAVCGEDEKPRCGMSCTDDGVPLIVDNIDNFDDPLPPLPRFEVIDGGKPDDIDDEDSA